MSIYFKFFLIDTEASVSKVVFILYVHYNVLTLDIPFLEIVIKFSREYQEICKSFNTFSVLVQVSVETLNH